MKKVLLVFALFSLSLACSSDNDDMGGENPGGETGEEVSGNFVSDTHPTSGMAMVDEEVTTLTLTNFKTDDGPRLLIYLSTDVDSNDFVNLGDIKGLDGDYTYAIPAGTDINKYKYVVVWCVDFLVSFGHAELE